MAQTLVGRTSPATLAIPNHEALAPGRPELMTAAHRPAESRTIT